MWTGTFGLLCGTQTLGFAHNGLLTPAIPLYLTAIGSSELGVGLVLAAFSLTSFVARPFLGTLADVWSVRGVLRLGCLFLGSACAGLALPNAWSLAVANGFRGLGWSGLNTGGNTLLAYIAPNRRRAEAASYLSLCQNAPMSLAPPLALWLLNGGPLPGFGAVFALASGCAVVAAALTLGMPRLHAERELPADRIVERGLSRLFDPGVFLASMLLFSLSLVQPVTSAFVPLYARSLGIEIGAVSWYYVATGLSVLVGQAVLGQVGDRLGRAVAMAAGFLVCALALGLVFAASSLWLLVLGGSVFALGSALVLPSSMALAIDRANPRRRGTAMASYSMWFQVGNGAGAAAAGLVADLFGLRASYLLALAPPLVGLAIVVRNWRGIR
jgi:MFS family permease